LKIRVKVVVTKFHKGRLKISYDPRNDITSTNPAENTVYTEILDIGEKDDVTFTIPYHQDLGWLKTDDSFSTNWTPGNTLAPRVGTDNGVLTVRVLNTLTAPAAGSVNLLFFVTGGDNFEFANPKGANVITNSVPTPFALQGEELTDVVSESIVIGTPSQMVAERYGQNFGEAILSLRTLLHRSSLAQYTASYAITNGIYNFRYSEVMRMPTWPGYDPSARLDASKIVAASGTAKFSAVYANHLPYVAGMFLGYRGSVNYAITPSGDNLNSLDDVKVFRSTGATNNIRRSQLVPTTSTLAAATVGQRVASLSPWGAQQLDLGQIVDGLGGMGITCTRTNGSVTFNFPDYNNYNFSLAEPNNYLLGSSDDGTNIQSAAILIRQTNSFADTTDLASSLALQIEAGAGPDFTCLHFLCCQTLDYLTVTPTF
jgi:hypothetical protein